MQCRQLRVRQKDLAGAVFILEERTEDKIFSVNIFFMQQNSSGKHLIYKRGRQADTREEIV